MICRFGVLDRDVNLTIVWCGGKIDEATTGTTSCSPYVLTFHLSRHLKVLVVLLSSPLPPRTMSHGHFFFT
jgi:hypothetical protein